MTTTNGRITIIVSLLTALAAGQAMAQDEDLKVSRTDAMKAAVTKVQPVYPLMARQLHIEGTVEVEAHIGEDGSVESAKPLTGNPVLLSAAVAATKQWKFNPFIVDGKAVKAVAPLTFSFKI